MSNRVNEAAPAPLPATAQELADLTAVVSRWGMEAGFLGIEGHLEDRLAALVRESSVRLFGNCDAERDRLLVQIEAAEKEIEDTAREAEKRREVRKSIRGRFNLLARIQLWFAELAGAKAARSLRRRNGPEVRQARLKFELADCARRDANEWREMATQSLRANYEYHKTRAALVRPATQNTEKELSHDARDDRQFMVHGAN